MKLVYMYYIDLKEEKEIDIELNLGDDYKFKYDKNEEKIKLNRETLKKNTAMSQQIVDK